MVSRSVSTRFVPFNPSGIRAAGFIARSAFQQFILGFDRTEFPIGIRAATPGHVARSVRALITGLYLIPDQPIKDRPN